MISSNIVIAIPIPSHAYAVRTYHTNIGFMLTNRYVLTRWYYEVMPIIFIRNNIFIKFIFLVDEVWCVDFAPNQFKKKKNWYWTWFFQSGFAHLLLIGSYPHQVTSKQKIYFLTRFAHQTFSDIFHRTSTIFLKECYLNLSYFLNQLDLFIKTVFTRVIASQAAHILQS